MKEEKAEKLKNKEQEHHHSEREKDEKQKIKCNVVEYSIPITV